MNKDLLFPQSFRIVGWILTVPFMLLGLIVMLWKDQPSSGIMGEYTDEIVCVALIVGLLFIGFSRLKVEDEMIMKLRLEALQWGLYINYMYLTVAVIVFYDFDFLKVLIYNMFTPLLVFVIRFYWLLYKVNTR